MSKEAFHHPAEITELQVSFKSHNWALLMILKALMKDFKDKSRTSKNSMPCSKERPRKFPLAAWTKIMATKTSLKHAKTQLSKIWTSKKRHNSQIKYSMRLNSAIISLNQREFQCHQTRRCSKEMHQLLRLELLLMLISKTNNHLSFQTLIRLLIRNKMKWLTYHKYSNRQEEMDMTLMR